MKQLANCIWDDMEPPAFILELERELTDTRTPTDAYYAADELALTLYEFASIRAKLRTREVTDTDAMEQVAQIEMKMVSHNSRTFISDTCLIHATNRSNGLSIQ